ncbi:MAG TPA: hypothetical protein DCS55_20225 [Acidimicrobiaceae bacterium]|nr:hypothetical protein [Acidimicrobiaceae bacterium]
MRRILALLMTGTLAVAACSEADPDEADAGAAPIADALTAEVSLEPGHELVGRLVVEHDEPTAPVIEVTGDERSFTIPVTGAATRHELPVAGLRAEQDYVITVRDGDEEVRLDLRTGRVPDDIPTLDIATAEVADMSDGLTMFNLLGAEGDDPGDDPVAGMLLIVDAAGEVVWYHRSNHPVGDARMLDDGTILHEYNDTGARRIDLFGRTLEEWGGDIITGPLLLDEHGRQVIGDDTVEVATDSMHHEVGMTDEGTLLALSTELRTYDDIPTGTCDDDADRGGTHELIVDVVVEYGSDGEVVAEYPLADHLDPVGDPRDQNICGLDFDDVFPNWLYRAQGHAEARDWTHANGAVVDPTGDNITVSVRHLDAILQIERATGDLVWRFGPGGDFAVEHPSDYPSYQHAPEWQDDGTLLLYDNGNRRASPPGAPEDAPPTSRAIQYRLDPDAGTAEVVWQRTSTVDGEPSFASFVGDADRLENGNVLITDGGYADRPDGITAQITEVVPDDSEAGGRIVFDLRIADERELIIYRAERIPTLYPTP